MQTDNFMAKLFDYNAWANRELFAAVGALDADGADKQLHTMMRILNHVYVVDQIFHAHLSGQPQLHTAVNTAATPSVDELRLAVEEMDRWYAGYAAAASAAELAEALDFRFVDGSAGRMTRGEMLFHVVNHGSYHRGAVGNVLVQLGVAPPKDVFTRFLHQPA